MASNRFPLTSIPIFVHQLFLDSEDTGFFEHRGYDVAAITHALRSIQYRMTSGKGLPPLHNKWYGCVLTDKTYERKLTEVF